ncbi:MAG: hypothetical protein HQ564_02780 [Candidatus Saganbacteria bacterium]|nr:hypothetical protein [Candidatus Saganbacteria bacterium]
MTKVFLDKPRHWSKIEPVTLKIIGRSVPDAFGRRFITADALNEVKETGTPAFLTRNGVIVNKNYEPKLVQLPTINLRMSQHSTDYHLDSYRTIFVSYYELSLLAGANHLRPEDLGHNMFIVPKIRRNSFDIPVHFLWQEALTAQWAYDFESWIRGEGDMITPNKISWPVSIRGKFTLPLLLTSLRWQRAQIGDKAEFLFFNKSSPRIQITLAGRTRILSASINEVQQYRSTKDTWASYRAVWNFNELQKVEEGYDGKISFLGGRFENLLGLGVDRTFIAVEAEVVDERICFCKIEGRPLYIYSSGIVPLAEGKTYYFDCLRIENSIFIDCFADRKKEDHCGILEIKLKNGYPEYPYDYERWLSKAL